jgi:hypothetical protein
MSLRGPLFKWYGSKFQSAKRYPPPLQGVPLIEPFAGGAGYSCRYPSLEVIVWDKNPVLGELWRWLIGEATSSMIQEIPIGIPEGTSIDQLGLSRGQALLLKHWQRTNNVGPSMLISPWGNKPGQWTANTRARLCDEIYLVKHWKFEKPSHTQLGTWFIDPPYQDNYRYGFKKFDYPTLAKFIDRIPPASLVIVCEAVNKETRSIPNWLPFEINHSSVTSRRKATQSHHSLEVVYTRYPRKSRTGKLPLDSRHDMMSE